MDKSTEINAIAGTGPHSGACARVIGVGLFICAFALCGDRDLGLERFTIPKDLVLNLGAWVGALAFLKGRRQCILELPLAGMFFLLLIDTFFAAIGSTNQWYAWRSACASTSAVALFLLAFALAAEGQGARLVTSVACSIVAVSLVALAECTGVIPRLSMNGRAPGGSLGNRNFLSHFVVVGVAFVVVELHRQRDLRLRILWTAGLASAVAAITVTRCRASWVAGAVLVSCTAFALTVQWSALTSETRTRWGLVGMALLAGGAAGVLIFGRTLSWTPGDYGVTLARIADHRSGTGKGRITQYAATLRMLAANPVFGVGPGQWSIAYSSYAEPTDPNYRPKDILPVNRLPNSDWLGFAAERGLPAVGLVFAIAVLLLRRAAQNWTDRTEHAAAFCAATATLLVVGTFDAVLFRPEMAYLAAVVLGSTAGASAARECPMHRLPSRRLCAAVASLALVVTVGLAGSRMAAAIIRHGGRLRDLERAFAFDPGNYVLATEIAQRHIESGRCGSAVSYARAALLLSPAARMPQAILRGCIAKGTEDPR